MARIVLTAVLVVLLNVLVGCGSADSGRSQLRPRLGTSLDTAPAVEVGKAAAEVDIVEQMAVSRQAYRQGLLMLIDHYTKAGSNMKLQWAKKELAALEAMPRYNYIIEAVVAGPNLKAAASIPEADQLYDEAVKIHKKAKKLLLVKNDNQLRLALDKYNQVIKKHPSSDKIDDAAFKAGEICEYFRDYSFALVYFKRTYQWDPETSYPARFRAAFILDKRLHRRGEALELYQQAIETEGKHEKYRNWKQFAEKRIGELTKIDE
jgi:TolA-binding protein